METCLSAGHMSMRCLRGPVPQDNDTPAGRVAVMSRSGVIGCSPCREQGRQHGLLPEGTTLKKACEKE